MQVAWHMITASLPVREPDAVQVLSGAIAIPNMDVLVLQYLSRCAAANEPQKLLCHTCTIVTAECVRAIAGDTDSLSILSLVRLECLNLNSQGRGSSCNPST